MTKNSATSLWHSPLISFRCRLVELKTIDVFIQTVKAHARNAMIDSRAANESDCKFECCLFVHQLPNHLQVYTRGTPKVSPQHSQDNPENEETEDGCEKREEISKGCCCYCSVCLFVCLIFEYVCDVLKQPAIHRSVYPLQWIQ